MNYVIVKYAKEEVWDWYFDSPPSQGVHKSYSAHDTYTGQSCNIQSSYATMHKAEEDCAKMNKKNPIGYYAVCPIAT